MYYVPLPFTKLLFNCSTLFYKINWTANDHSLKVKDIFDKILGPSVFNFLSVRACVCVSVCPKAVRHSFDHTTLSIHI